MANKDKNEKKNDKKFFKEIKAELKKVTWPTSKELITNTSAVISIVLILAIIVFVLDVCFDKINNLGVGGIQKVISSTENVTDEENNESTETIDLNSEDVQVVTETEENADNNEASTDENVTE